MRRNRIRGPQSALTDFLASNNISAHQIHQDYQRRVREAEQREAAEQETAEQEYSQHEHDDDYQEAHAGESPEQKKKRKRKEATTLAKIKQSKEFARRKSQRLMDVAGDDSDEEHDDMLAKEMIDEKSRPIPGQLENCEKCGKRFTVTPYSKTGPNGGLLCVKCSKDVADDAKKTTPRKRGPRSGRRQVQSNLLDGIIQYGAMSLAEMCTKKVAENIDDVEEFGDLPSPLLHRLSQILSKRRVLTPRTLNLFLRPELHSIDIYDCAKLETDDFQKIFAYMPSLTQVNLRYAGQLKDRVLEYMTDRNSQIKDLQFDAVNLVTDACWRRVFQKYGSQLESVKLSNLDYSFDDETVEDMCKHCTGLRRLKLTQCWKTGDRSLKAIAGLKSLEHLSLNFVEETSKEELGDIILNVGSNLQTLSLDGFHHADDHVLGLIHSKCHSLVKFRLSDNAVCTDQAYAQLFTGWQNPPLEYVDLSSTRDVDNSNPDGPEELIGLASQGFVALMDHSGSKIQKLNIASCRHVSREAFEEIFSEGKKYPHLTELDVSFHMVMDDFLIGRIFRCCPAIKKLVAFACFNVRDVRVPAGVALIGSLRAQDPIVVEGRFQK